MKKLLCLAILLLGLKVQALQCITNIQLCFTTPSCADSMAWSFMIEGGSGDPPFTNGCFYLPIICQGTNSCATSGVQIAVSLGFNTCCNAFGALDIATLTVGNANLDEPTVSHISLPMNCKSATYQMVCTGECPNLTISFVRCSCVHCDLPPCEPPCP